MEPEKMVNRMAKDGRFVIESDYSVNVNQMATQQTLSAEPSDAATVNSKSKN
jgi:hypothetical protein